MKFERAARAWCSNQDLPLGRFGDVLTMCLNHGTELGRNAHWSKRPPDRVFFKERSPQLIRIPSIAPTLAIVLLLLGGAQARCDFIPWRSDVEVQQRTIGKPGAVRIDLIQSGTGPFQSGPARSPLVDVQLVDDRNAHGGRASAVIDYVISLFITDQNSH